MLDMKTLIKQNEEILWEGRPDVKTTVLESIFNPLLVFALIWAAFDLFMMKEFFSATGDGRLRTFILGFLLIHMMPVWLYLFGVITSVLRWKNTRFLITTGGLYVSGGVFTFNYEMKPWVDIGHINIHQGIFDRIFGVGDVQFVCGHASASSHDDDSAHSGMKIYNISDFENVFRICNNLQTDIFSDTMYPNDLRPENNPGYNTRYNGRDRF